MFGKRAIVAAVTAVLMAGLGACSGGGDGGSGSGGAAVAGDATQSPPTPDTVFGLRDTVRHVSARTTKATRPHLVTQCTTASRRVRHTSHSGSGKRRTTRTWYTTEHYRTCKKVRRGTETYRKVLSRERWCVRLDDVGGHASQDDVWYRVDHPAYNEALGADDHARLEFTPQGTGC